MLSEHSWSSAILQRQAGWLLHVSVLGLSVSGVCSMTPRHRPPNCSDSSVVPRKSARPERLPREHVLKEDDLSSQSKG